MFKKLFTICLVLLLCASAYGTPVSRADVQTTATAIEVDTNALQLLSADKIALMGIAGNVWYVDSSATGSGTGADWTNAETTIKLGITNYAADNGDALIIAPGHAETFTAADAADFTKAGVKVFGLGVGENAPTITYTTNGELVLGADDIEIHNINFIAGNGVVHAIDVEAGVENYWIDNCRFWTTTVNTDEFIDCIDVAAGSDNGRITNCRVEMGAAAAVSFVSHVGSDYTEISGNKVFGDFSTACIEDATTASIWMNIHDNLLVNGTVGGTAGLNTEPCITLKADSSAVITDNKCFCNVATEDLAIVAADGLVEDNTYVETEGSVLIPGQVYVMESATVVAAATDNMFTVAGGQIEIVSLFGECTTLTGTVGATDIYLDATDGSDYDRDFCTAVDIDALGTGDIVSFTNAVSEGVLTFVANNGAGQPLSWFCSAGVLILDPATTDTGAITWYMAFRPLTTGVTVTVGP